METTALLEKYYLSRPSFVDGTTVFHRLCRSLAPAGAQILEIGPGPDNPTSHFLRSLGNLCGVDVTDEAEGNPALSEFRLFDGIRLPYEDASFDLCVSNYVLEHVPDPRRHFREVARVLRPRGVYCFRTPNQWHYVAIVSRLLPHSAHLKLANRLRGLADDAHDPYLTHYRANSRRNIRRYAGAAGLEPIKIDIREHEPTYGRCHPALFYPMMLYERAVNASSLLTGFRMAIFAAFRKAPLTA